MSSMVHSRCILKNLNKNVVTETVSSSPEEQPMKRLKLSDQHADWLEIILQELERYSNIIDNTWEWSPFLENFRTSDANSMEERIEKLFYTSVPDLAEAVDIDGIKLRITGEPQVSLVS